MCITMDRAALSLTVFGFLLVWSVSGLNKQENEIDIYSFHINSTVTSRYAITIITSRVANRLNESKEVHFQVQIPKNAFINRFRMTMEGKMYDGVVKEKEEAQQQYSQAVSRGESAGIVSSVGRTLEEFKTSVTVAAFSKVTFELTYEELLKRQLGQYQLLINAQPMQTVADFKIDVYIHENPGISFLAVNGGLNTKELANAVTITRSDKEVWVNFYPTREQQTNCDVCGPTGLKGDLIINYDVERQNPSGALQASEGYFVHYFAPTDVQRIPKNVVFVIDRSGSMSGRKIQQTREALLKILGDISEEDHFGLVTFDSHIDVWNPELLPASEGNLQKAKDFVRMIRDRGYTNINDAVLKGVEMINRHQRERSASILILLTDGAPNTGESDPIKIQANVKKAIGGKFPLYCLGFGFDVNFEFLQKMALENSGRAVRIYEDSDADLQLQGFYEEVATPLLTDIQLNYTGARNLTQTTFSHYYNGSEIVVAGQITDNSLESLQTTVIAISRNSNMIYQDFVFTKDLAGVLPQHENFIERIWAYLTIKQLLEKEVALSGQEKEKIRGDALDLALKYKFVTPLTSMVVTKPQEEETQVANKPKEGEKTQRSHRQQSRKGQLSKTVPVLKKKARPLYAKDMTPRVSPIPRSFVPLFSSIKTKGPHSLFANGGVVLSDSAARILQPHRHPPLVNGVRFLISAPNQRKPLCYDVPAASKLCLLTDPSSDFSMNGRLSSKGFKHIVLRYKTNHSLTLNTNNIRYSDGLNHAIFTWKQGPTNHETASVSLVIRNNEVDVTMGSIRIVFFRHKKNGETFLWPSVQQQPTNQNIKGTLGTANLEYEELPGSVIKIKDKQEMATWSNTTDYRRSSAPVLGCWLVPFQLVLKGELTEFTVSKL
ncbi:inter-alpha-trypsin inhibitor heavy chain H3-like isoform X3 [Hoplias malabaricus]|uniref:inter-alpha-trypsin inhibitor heavy chain H3-like isoform X3 n=1 Tax=Hoplias malabaricus TaxID=27720 RepID=UPI003462CBCB